MSKAAKQALGIKREDIYLPFRAVQKRYGWISITRCLLLLRRRSSFPSGMSRVAVGLPWKTDESLRSKDMPWNAPPGPIPADARPLSVPKPDIGLGLKVLSKLHYQQAKATIDMREAVLSAPVLTDLNSNSTIRLVASPSPGLAKMAFPFLVYEAKSDSSSMFFAENQVAGGAAKCLALQRQVWHPSMASPPLSFAICSQGALWEVFLSFFDNQSESYVCPG